MASDVDSSTSRGVPNGPIAPRLHQLVVEQTEDPSASGMISAVSTPDPSRLSVYERAAQDDWSADPSSVSDNEDYDELRLDPSAVMDGSTGAGAELSLQHRDSAIVMDEDTPRKNGKRQDGDTNGARRQSIQVIFEKTNKKGRYILTADDPELREILKAGLQREKGIEPSTKSRTTFRDMVFTRRFTTFDRQNPLGADSPFRGFFTLFWIAMGLLLGRIAAQNWKAYGSFLGRAEILHMMVEKDLFLLGVTDGVMCASTLFGLFLQKLILKGYLTWGGAGWIIQNLWQALYLGGFIGWTYYRDWPWTHTVFIVLHSLVFLMKQHSYAFYNGYLSQVYRRRQIVEQKLRQLEDMSPTTSPTSVSPVRTFANMASTTGMSPLSRKSSLTERRRSLAAKASTNLDKEETEVSAIAAAIDAGEPLDQDQMEAFSRLLRAEIRSLTEELNGKCTSSSNAYPNNLTIANWADWTCLPTLVYELEYPRQEKINWWYVAEKTSATFGVIWIMMVISQTYIYPPVLETVAMKESGLTLAERWVEFPWIVSDILFPLLLEQLLTWYVIWECCLNVLAELTKFADRGFYGDWWNSVSWDQYARDWNRPVHNFLLRHVYHSSISAFHLSKSTATFVTFLLSACVHELIMLCLFKKVRGYLFTMQLLQLPLVMASRTKLLKGRDLLGNVVFWFGLFVGPSIIMSLYLIV
jgi:sterol O-acyltransferase